MKVLMITSPGGHLAQMLPVRAALTGDEIVWVTFDTPHADGLALRDRVHFAAHPTTRNLPNALRNLRLSWSVLRDERPDVVVSTGAGVAAPFFVMAWALKIPTVFIEVCDRVHTRTLTGTLVYPFVSRFAVQLPEQERLYPEAEMVGCLL